MKTLFYLIVLAALVWGGKVLYDEYGREAFGDIAEKTGSFVDKQNLKHILNGPCVHVLLKLLQYH